MNRRRRESKQSVVVVLEGIKVCGKTSTGLLPLKRVMRDVVNHDDEILVLALLQVEPPPDEVNRCNGGSCNTDPYTSFLQQEISQKNDIYKKIFRSFYDSCKHKGVKFQVKTAAGFHLKDLVLEEANNSKATWIVMDSCFARHFTFRMSGTNYNVSLVSDDEEAMIDNCSLKIDGSKTSIIEDMDCNSRSPKLIRGLTSKCEHCYNSPTPASTSKESGHNKTLSEPYVESEVSGKVNPPQEEEIQLQETFIEVPKKFDDARILLGQPLQFSWEDIQNITGRFQYNISWLQGKNFESFMGHLPDADSFVMVQRFSGDWYHILEAEKKAAMSLHHRNILTLIGYHKSKDHMFLVFPHQSQKTLEKYLFDSPWRRKELSFQQRMQVAIGTAQGLRYMHQECRHGPILHGELLPSTIFLNHNFQPMISGFEYARWLGREQEASTSNSRYEIGDSLHQRSMTLIKTDVLAFGVLLLRLFCKRSIPPDDRILLDMARPVLLQRAFHELLDEEESEDSDVHAIYRVMTAASLCTKKRPSSRPLMSEVVPILKGEVFCPGLSSPSDNSS